MSSLADIARDVARDLELRHAAAEQRDLELTETERWARDPIGWINAHAWVPSPFTPGETYDAAYWQQPKRKIRPTRLVLFPGQEETIRAWIDLDHLQATGELLFRDAAGEKSRQIGETQAIAAALCWACHYHGSLLGLVMSKVGADVDNGGTRNTPDSIFGRVRYIDERVGSIDGTKLTADRTRVAGCHERLVFRPFSREPAKIEHPTNGSVILGAGQTDDPGRGKTLAFFFGDEFDFVEHSDRVYAAIDEACPFGKLLLSTVQGEGTELHRLCEARPRGYTILRLHWTDHPIYSQGLHIAGEDPDCALCEGNRRKLRWSPQHPLAHRYPGKPTSPWYDSRVIGKTDEQVANELDIDRARARSGRVYPEFTDDVHVDPAGVPYDHDLMGSLELMWDFGLDVTAVVVCQDAAFEYRVIGLLECGDLYGTSGVPERVHQQLIDYLADLGVPDEFLTPIWTRKIRCFGDPSEQGRDRRTGMPGVQAYRRLGWNIDAPPRSMMRTVQPSISAVKRLLLGTPKPLRVCGVNAPDFATHMRNNTWPVDASGRRRLGGGPPVDDLHNHACRAFAYGIVTKWPPPVDPTDGRAEAEETARSPRDRASDGRIDAGIRYGMSL